MKKDSQCMATKAIAALNEEWDSLDAELGKERERFDRIRSAIMRRQKSIFRAIKNYEKYRDEGCDQ